MASRFESGEHPTSDDSMMSVESQGREGSGSRRTSASSNCMISLLNILIIIHTNFVNLASMASRRSEPSFEQVLQEKYDALLQQAVRDADKRVADSEASFRAALEVAQTSFKMVLDVAEERRKDAEERCKDAEERFKIAELRHSSLLAKIARVLSEFKHRARGLDPCWPVEHLSFELPNSPLYVLPISSL